MVLKSGDLLIALMVVLATVQLIVLLLFGIGSWILSLRPWLIKTFSPLVRPPQN